MSVASFVAGRVARKAAKEAVVQTAVTKTRQEKIERIRQEHNVSHGDAPISGPIIPGGTIDELGDLPL